MPAAHLYDSIGVGYSVGRRTDPRIARHIHAALGPAQTVINVGAGTGSYEPEDRLVVAVEPSVVMRAQRSRGAAPVVAAVAEALPFRTAAVDAAMAVLSDQHWHDPIRGLRELARVARKGVVFQWDSAHFDDFWLIRDYLPEVHDLAAASPSFAERAAAIGAEMVAVPVPWDCQDGFFHAYWRRPRAYLDPAVRRATSVWARVGAAVERRAVAALATDLARGDWQRRNADLLDRNDLDLGARLLVTQ